MISTGSGIVSITIGFVAILTKLGEPSSAPVVRIIIRIRIIVRAIIPVIKIEPLKNKKNIKFNPKNNNFYSNWLILKLM